MKKELTEILEGKSEFSNLEKLVKMVVAYKQYSRSKSILVHSSEHDLAKMERVGTFNTLYFLESYISKINEKIKAYNVLSRMIKKNVLERKAFKPEYSIANIVLALKHFGYPTVSSEKDYEFVHKYLLKRKKISKLG